MRPLEMMMRPLAKRLDLVHVGLLREGEDELGETFHLPLHGARVLFLELNLAPSDTGKPPDRDRLRVCSVLGSSVWSLVLELLGVESQEPSHL